MAKKEIKLKYLLFSLYFVKKKHKQPNPNSQKRKGEKQNVMSGFISKKYNENTKEIKTNNKIVTNILDKKFSLNLKKIYKTIGYIK